MFIMTMTVKIYDGGYQNDDDIDDDWEGHHCYSNQ